MSVGVQVTRPVVGLMDIPGGELAACPTREYVSGCPVLVVAAI